MFLARGLSQPYLKASIRHAFKALVHFDSDLIATEGETFPSGSVATGRNRRSFCCRQPQP
ncbi:hypothetical protein EOD08_07100 [Mesorhizobium sp. M6A.T.Ca.TU.002.02.2.1]|nr:hypothetical protein EOD08_07100 [Mesorhizobium sp. M6A.T.Ca.TU.002.02.2.1]